MNGRAIRDVVIEAVSGGQIAGAVVAVTTVDATLLQLAVGRRRVDAPAQMQRGGLFWSASMTKAITKLATLQMVEQGKLSLDRPIGGVLPDLAVPVILDAFESVGAPLLRPAQTKLPLSTC